MKKFVNTLYKDGECFAYLSKQFPGLSNEKLKEGIFDGQQIRQLIKDPNFVECMNELEKRIWNCFVSVIQNFLWNCKSEN